VPGVLNLIAVFAIVSFFGVYLWGVTKAVSVDRPLAEISRYLRPLLTLWLGIAFVLLFVLVCGVVILNFGPTKPKPEQLTLFVFSDPTAMLS